MFVICKRTSEKNEQKRERGRETETRREGERERGGEGGEKRREYKKARWIRKSTRMEVGGAT